MCLESSCVKTFISSAFMLGGGAQWEGVRSQENRSVQEQVLCHQLSPAVSSACAPWPFCFSATLWHSRRPSPEANQVPTPCSWTSCSPEPWAKYASFLYKLFSLNVSITAPENGLRHPPSKGIQFQHEFGRDANVPTKAYSRNFNVNFGYRLHKNILQVCSAAPQWEKRQRLEPPWNHKGATTILCRHLH